MDSSDEGDLIVISCITMVQILEEKKGPLE